APRGRSGRDRLELVGAAFRLRLAGRARRPGGGAAPRLQPRNRHVRRRPGSRCEGGPRHRPPAVIGVLVSGTGTNLQALLDAGLPVSAVASSTPGVQALERAETASVPGAAFPLDAYPGREPRDAAMADWLEAHGARVVVCAGYMQLLTAGFLARFPCLNVHPSLLPAFPGLDAVGQALAAGVEETGGTV